MFLAADLPGLQPLPCLLRAQPESGGSQRQKPSSLGPFDDSRVPARNGFYPALTLTTLCRLQSAPLASASPDLPFSFRQVSACPLVRSGPSKCHPNLRGLLTNTQIQQNTRAPLVAAPRLRNRCRFG